MSAIQNNYFFKRVIFSFISCISLVILSYFFIDKPLAIWLYKHELQHDHVYQWLTYIPNIFVYISFIILICVLPTSKLSQLNRKFLKVIFAISISTYISLVLTKFLKFVFGRVGPEYWISNTFDQNAYGFSLFHGGSKIFQDFPSGHSAVGFVVITIMWLVYPKLRWFSVLLGITIIISLLCTASHFLGDCIAGAFLGALLGVLAINFFEFEIEKT
jgi:membrane-associated phospholipid phosphatase